MSLEWKAENPPRWDAGKQRIVGEAPEGVFHLPSYAEGDLIAGDWWRVERDGETVGYGWMDCVWGDAEILLAVDDGARGSGVGSFILEHLEREAAAHGLNYMFNVVRPNHPDRETVTRWLEAREFARSDDESLRRRVRSVAT
jgi:N-acetylglutamate synthase-like GNAT family acetyltransferase